MDGGCCGTVMVRLSPVFLAQAAAIPDQLDSGLTRWLELCELEAARVWAFLPALPANFESNFYGIAHWVCSTATAWESLHYSQRRTLTSIVAETLEHRWRSAASLDQSRRR